MGKLDSYASKAPEFQKLPEGDQNVRLVSYRVSDSFHQFDGSLKDNLPEYENPTEQLIVTCVSTSGKGGITHRLNMEGYTRFNELTDKQLQSGKFVDVDGYACARDIKTKKLIRLSDPKRTATCEGILDQMFAAMNIPVGNGIEALEDVIAEKVEFTVKVTKEDWEGKDQYRIGSFKKAVVAVPTTSDLEA